MSKHDKSYTDADVQAPEPEAQNDAQDAAAVTQTSQDLAKQAGSETPDSGPPAPESDTSALLAMLADLQKQLTELKSAPPAASLPHIRSARQGSQARPNVVYELLERSPKFARPPQVDQLIDILFTKAKELGKSSLTEPEAKSAIEDGAAVGKLRTKQNPFRIFQYYRPDLIGAGVLTMK